MGAMRSKLAFLLVFLASGPALAQQLVTFDQVITITQQGNGSGAFHYTIKPAATEPASWTSPVDYSKGTAYVHMNVMEKPSKRNTTLTICFDGNLEGYGCITTPAYTDVGIRDSKHVLPSATWQYNQIAWNRRRQEYHLVVKDPALGGTPGGRPATDYTPTKMRVVMTVVPVGGTYTPPPGAASPSVDGGAAPDAATGGDAMAGTGGSSGSGTGGSTGAGGSGTGGSGTGATGGSASSTGGSAGGGTGGSGASSGGSSGTGTGGSGNAGGSSASGGSTGSGTGGSTGGAAPPRTNPPPSGNPPPTNTGGASGGCSVAPTGGASSWLLLAVVAIPALLRRGRQKHGAGR
jgi:MYXO-CTERM domain-containing protein